MMRAHKSRGDFLNSSRPNSRMQIPNTTMVTPNAQSLRGNGM